MIIHTVKKGENIFSIARKYAVSPIKIIENNCLPYPDRLIPGQMLLILIPTRTYIVRGGDTVSKLCRRFDIKKRALIANNPSLHGHQILHAGTELVIRYDAPSYGILTINGYVYETTSADRFWTMLPYLTYVTFCGQNEHTEEWTCAVKKERKIPLLRLNRKEIYEKYKKDPTGFFAEAEQVKKMGYGGITLSAASLGVGDDVAGRFLLEIKKQLLGMDMLLFQETKAEFEEEYADAADGIVALYEKCHKREIPSFDEGEISVLQRFSERMETGKAFLELSAFGYDGEKALTIEQILKIAIKYGAEIENDAERKTSHLDYILYRNGEKKPLRISFESMENIKAKLELVHEFGFLGAAVDIGRIPISYVMMLHNLFASVEQPYVKIFNA